MAKQYPRLGETRQVHPQGLCKLCGEPKADSRNAIEVNVFRGDDTVVKVHEWCLAAEVMKKGNLLDALTA